MARDPNRIAVILIHGVGEQLPMETLRSFADITWKLHGDQFKSKTTLSPEIWSKPDYFGDTFETRRLSTSENDKGQRVDFFEFYWAHLMAETKTARVLEWLKSLLLRNPFSVPQSIRPAYWFLMSVTVFLGLMLALVKWGVDLLGETHQWLFGWATALLGVIWASFAAKVHDVAGDAARYLHHSPKNVVTRHEIRKRGVELLENVIKSPRNYGRVIVVGHSLGSVIGYDIVCQAFSRSDRKVPEQMMGTGLQKTVDSIQAARDGNSGDEYERQQELWAEAMKPEWPVTDFITLGSPLAHADSLVETNEETFRRRVQLREFPVCPPVLERARTESALGAPVVAYQDDDETRLHHGAVFLPTRWTNLFFTHRRHLMGDPIGGRLAHLFGPGVHDYGIPWSFSFKRMGHTSYWFDENSEAVARLRATLWG